MSTWRYLAARLDGAGGLEVIDKDLPLSDVSIEETLSAPGGLTATIEPEYTRLKTPDGEPLFDEWSTAIFAELDGEIRGGGILNHSGFSGPKWALECVGYLGYWKDMPYTGNGEFFVKTDTLDIVRRIVDHVQAQQGGNLGLTVSSQKSGVLVGSELASEEYDPEGGPGGLTLQSQSYKLAWYQDHDLLSNIDGLAEDTPFDWRTSYYWDGDQIRSRLDFGVPRIGRNRTDLRLVIGENVFEVPDVDRSGEDYASEVYGLGAGEGAKMIRGHASAPRGNRLRRVTVVNNSSIRRLSTATTFAQNELRWRQRLDELSAITVRNTSHAPLGSIGIGDEIRLTGPTGWVEVDAQYRVLAITTNPQDNDSVELSVARSDRVAS